MTPDESKSLSRGSRVYWQGDVADSGTITETNWNAVTIAWNNGHTATFTTAICEKSNYGRIVRVSWFRLLARAS